MGLRAYSWVVQMSCPCQQDPVATSWLTLELRWICVGTARPVWVVALYGMRYDICCTHPGWARLGESA